MITTATATTTTSTVVDTSAGRHGGSEASSPTTSTPTFSRAPTPADQYRGEPEAGVDGDLILEAIIMGSQRGGSDVGGMKNEEEEEGECWEGFRVRWL